MELLRWVQGHWDRTLGFFLIALGAALSLLAYRGVSNSPHSVEDLSYLISGGIGALLALGVGATLLVCSDMRDEFRILGEVEASLKREGRDSPLIEQREEQVIDGESKANRSAIPVIKEAARPAVAR